MGGLKKQCKAVWNYFPTIKEHIEKATVNCSIGGAIAPPINLPLKLKVLIRDIV